MSAACGSLPNSLNYRTRGAQWRDAYIEQGDAFVVPALSAWTIKVNKYSWGIPEVIAMLPAQNYYSTDLGLFGVCNWHPFNKWFYRSTWQYVGYAGSLRNLSHNRTLVHIDLLSIPTHP